jgi:hypothetical protein
VSIEKHTISLRIRSESVCATQIVEEIGINPEVMHTMGADRKTKDGQLLEGKYDHHYCVFHFEYAFEGDVSESLEYLTELLKKHKELFTPISDKGGSIEFFIGWFLPKNSGDVFDWRLLQKLADLRINLSFDLYSDNFGT